MQKLLYQIHRWGGIALALFMAMWFISGLVIMYAGPSTLGPSERLARHEPLDIEAGWLSLGEAWGVSKPQRATLDNIAPPDGERRLASKPVAVRDAETIVDARLARVAGQPLWLIENGRGRRYALSARDGHLHEINADEATQIAAQWITRDALENPTPVRHVDTGPQDSSVRNYEALRPFHCISVGNSGRELLISARNGEVVRDSTPLSRAGFWVGNWIHLLRPIEAVSNADTRRVTLAWLGFIAAAASLTGLIIGWQRWRPGLGGRPTYSKGRVHPYRDVWNTWHFWVGLIGGTAALLWALSGYLNSNPWQIFSPATASGEELRRYQGNGGSAAMFDWKPVVSNAADTSRVVELDWRRVGEQVVLLGLTADGERLPQTAAGAAPHFDTPSLLAAATRLAGKVPVETYTLQTDYDSYYYLRHHQDRLERPLPVLRVNLADASGTRLYLDAADGRLLLKQDASRRVYRWLYSALHHWDFGWLYLRPWWDAWMLPLVLMGIVLGLTSVVLGWKRLRQTFGKKKRKASRGDHVAHGHPITVSSVQPDFGTSP